MLRHSSQTIKLANEFLLTKNTIISRHYPDEAHSNEQLVRLIISSNYDDKYMNTMVASYMNVRLKHPLSNDVFKIANSTFFNDDHTS